MGFRHELVGLFHLREDLEDAPDVRGGQMDRHTASRHPPGGRTLHDCRDEVRAHEVTRNLEADEGLEGRPADDAAPLRELDELADVEDELLTVTTTPLLAELEVRRYIDSPWRLGSQGFPCDFAVVDFRTRLVWCK